MAKKNPSGDGSGKPRRRKKNPTFGARFGKSIKSSGSDFAIVGGMLLGNLLGQGIRSQVIARAPMGNVAGHVVDLGVDWFGVAPALEAMFGNNFGRGMALGVRFNSLAAAIKTFTPQGSVANRMLGVSEFIPEAPQRPVETPAETPNTGTTEVPGYRYMGTTAMPGDGGSNIGMRRVA